MQSPDLRGSAAAAPSHQPAPALDRYLDYVHEAVVTLDGEWRFGYLNQAAIRLCNRPAVELVGSVAWEVFPRIVGTRLYTELHRVAADRQCRRFEEYDRAFDRWVEIDAYPAEDGIIAVIRDVTEARKRERTVRDREERLRLALSFGRMGVWELDVATRRVDWSPELEAIHGLAPGSFDGRYQSVVALIHPEDMPALREASTHAMEHGGVLSHQFRAVWPDGTIRYLHSRGKTICDDHGKPATVLGITVDITDQVVAARQLQQRVEQLQLLFSLADAVSRAEDPADVYRAAVQDLADAVGADRASVAVFDDDEVLRYRAWAGLSGEYRASVEALTPWQRGSLDAQPIAVPDVSQEPFLSPYQEVFAKEGIRSVTFVPLLGKGGLIGKFVLYYDRRHDFHPEELRIAQTIATLVAHTAERQRAEMALRASEERFRSFFSQAAVGISQVGLDGKFLLLNNRFCEMLGYTEAELRQKTFMEITHPEDHDVSDSTRQQLLTGEVPWRLMEKRYVRKDGTTVWARLHVSLVRDHAGAPLYLAGVVEDVTDRVQAERALLDSEQSFAFAQSAARLGAWDRDLRTNQTTLSREYARLHGLAPGHPPLTHQEWLELIHPDDRARVEAAVRESIERTHTWDIEFRVVWPDGSVHWLFGKGMVYLDGSGRPVRMAGISVDVSERKQAEVALQESEERFRNMADTAPVMIWVAGPDKALTFFNKTWLDFVGRKLEQELNNGWVESLHPDDLERCFQSYCEAFDARESFHIEYRLRRADGEYRRVLCSGVPRLAPGGVFAGYIGSDIDITELRRAQEEDFERQKGESLSVLTGGIAHDFNNLLGSILADAELAEADLASCASPLDQIRRIKTVAVRAAEIVRELMIYSGQAQAEFAPLDLSALVGDMLELLKVSISKRAELKTDLPAGLPAVRGNATQLRQVVMNLAINASEAIGNDRGTIAVSTSLDTSEPSPTADGCLRLVVSDTGCGMTEEQQARVFEPFFTTKFSGRGLGMSVVQGIVRAHEGTILLASAPGQGTTFQIVLPCAHEPVAPRLAATIPADVDPAAGPAQTVLFVEDEEMLRQSVSKMLRKKGYSVIEAADGSAAIEHLRSSAAIDVILLDVTIPGSPSSQVMAEGRRLRPEIKVILTSAYSREMVTPSLAGPEISAFVRKPFSLADLLGSLRNTLAS